MPYPAPDLPWIVLKFGGTSVSARQRWDTIGALAQARTLSGQRRVLVVVSALSGVTSELMAIIEGAEDAHARVAALRARHLDFAQALGIPELPALDTHLQALHALLDDPRANTRAFDWQAELLAHGELLSSTLGAAYLRAQGLDIGWCDARDWLDATPLPHQSEWAGRLSASCERESNPDWRARFAAQVSPILITQGFIARHPDGGTAVLGRGGSDTSAALFGSLLHADAVEIWTDVPGMFSANPREVPEARLLTRLDYAEAQEIATTGAKVLHPRALGPCRVAGVPLSILDTQRPHLPGTRIDGDASAVKGVKAVSRRNGIVLVSMETVGMWHSVGFLADVFARFRAHGLSVDLIGSAETNVTVSLDPSENLVNTDVLARLSEDLAQFCRVKIIAPCSAITLVGRGMRSLMHRLSKVLAMFGHERVHLLSQSSNDLNLTFVIDETDADGLMPILHHALIDSGAMPVHEPDVFGPSWQEIIHGPPPARAPAWWQGEKSRLLALAETSTPQYVYHLPTIHARARALLDVGAVDRHFYAIKANPHPDILRALIAAGFGLECVSQGEIEHIFATLPDLAPERVLFTPSFAPVEEYAHALQRGITVTVDNLELLRHWPEVFRGHALWLRVDLGRGDGHHAKVVTGGAAAKFGLPVALVEEFTAAAQNLDIRITGLHAHLGSGIDQPRHWREVYAELAALADTIGTVDTIDIGGGLTIPYTPDALPFDLAAWAEGLSEIKQTWPRYQLAIEPGRYLVAEAGVLLLHATQVANKQGTCRVGVNAGMNALMRPALYDAWHGIYNLTRAAEPADMSCDIVGPICESGDILGHKRLLPASTTPGDVILIADAGAYGMVMSNDYNLRVRPAESILAS